MPALSAFFLLFLSVSAAMSARQPADTVTSLQEISVQGTSRRLIRGRETGRVSLNVDAMGRVMRAFGEADPLNYARVAGGVSAGSDYSSGLSVRGSGFSHSLYRIGEATVWFPYHFGGIYSMFNGMHFPRLDIDKGMYAGSAPSRLGAVFDVRSRDAHPDRLHASFNAGLTASSIGLRIPAGERFSIDLSGRISYLDRLYGPLLDMGDQTIGYTFGEGAVTARWTPRESDRVKLDAAFNSDRLRVFDNNFDLDTRLDWSNLATSLVWTHTGKIPFRVWTTCSTFRNTLCADMPGFGVDVPSEMTEVKAGGEITPCVRHGAVTAGAETIFYRARPQDVSGNGPSVDALELRLYASWTGSLGRLWWLTASIRGSFYATRGYSSGLPAPSVTLEYRGDSDRVALNVSASPQYVHQAGFADIGLSSNFWFPATSVAPRELAAGVSASYSRSFLGGALDIGIEPYFRRILHEPEYSGMMLDLIDKNYSLDGHLLRSNGFNTGFDLTANYSTGPLTALLSYSLGIARRRFPSDPERYLPAVSEGLNNLNALLSYTLGRHWTVGANFTLASGRCYTPVKAIYMLGENVMMVYGSRNSARMPLYHRLDLSGSYRFRTGGRFPLTHTVVLSLINAYGRRNIELCSYRFSADDGTFYLHQVPSLYRFLPSLSYTIDF